jgi:hypothetical protein
MNEQEWQSLLKNYQTNAVTRDLNRQQLIEKYKISITELLHGVGCGWSNKLTEAEGLDEVELLRMRYKLHYYHSQWRLTIWYGTYRFPASIPDLLDADGEDFYHNDIKTFPLFSQKYTGIIMITILDNGFRLWLEDNFKNLFCFATLYEDKSFATFSELENALNEILRKLKTHPIHHYQT